MRTRGPVSGASESMSQEGEKERASERERTRKGGRREGQREKEDTPDTPILETPPDAAGRINGDSRPCIWSSRSTPMRGMTVCSPSQGRRSCRAGGVAVSHRRHGSVGEGRIALAAREIAAQEILFAGAFT